jgi:DNA-binding transcriptional ArsR family regulator
MNMSEYTPNPQQMADAFAIIGQPARMQILLAIGSEKACVCQLEALLEQRQAYISQQLTLLRDAGLVESERSGRFIFYHLTDLRWLDVIKQAAVIMGVDLPVFQLPEVSGCSLSASEVFPSGSNGEPHE